MIVPMKKYLFLVHHSDYEGFLDGLRNLGILHVQFREGEPSETLLARMRGQKEIREVLTALRQRIVDKKDGLELSVEEGLDIVRSHQELHRRLEALQQELSVLHKEINFWKPWGHFSIGTLTELKQAGLAVHFFSCPQKQFRPEWAQQYLLKVISTQGPDVFFVVVAPEGEEIKMEAEAMPQPEASLSTLAGRSEMLEKQIEAINERLDRFAINGIAAVETALEEAENTTQLVAVIENTQREAEGAVMLLEGFAPKPRVEELERFCEAKDVPFLVENPKPGDAPPVLLKNSAFARLFEPIGELFSLPAYKELDLTPFFAPFFMMFFGFCLGDAGYGLVILLGATLYKRRAKTELKPALTLAQFLGVATVLFGVLTGTVFGINLLDERYAYLGSIRSFMLDSDQTFRLALLLGLLQIIFGLLIQAFNKIRQFGFKYSIATFGWIIMIISIFDLAVLKKTGTFSTYAVFFGAGLILLFNDPEAGFLGRLGKGVWELYGITGIFGDLLSYIRLFALGISSAILGFVVNDISLQIRDGIPFLGPVLFVLFLLVGHGANLLIASLGAFVHPMRLTFVEFYKNAGFTGGGKAYKPLSSNSQGAK